MASICFSSLIKLCEFHECSSLSGHLFCCCYIYVISMLLLLHLYFVVISVLYLCCYIYVISIQLIPFSMYIKFYLFVFSCAGSSPLLRLLSLSRYTGFSLQWPRCGASALECTGFSTVAPGLSRVQWLWHTGPVTPWHVGSSWIRNQTHVYCVGRKIIFFFFFSEA